MKEIGKAQRKKRGQGDRSKAQTARDHGSKAIKRRIKMQETVTVAELAKAMGLKGAELLGALLKQGVMVHINQAIDFETASLVSEGFGYELELDMFQEETLLAESEDQPEDFDPPATRRDDYGTRGPREDLTAGFYTTFKHRGGRIGCITQHIGAYYVETDGGDIVFLTRRATRPSRPCGPGAQR